MDSLMGGVNWKETVDGIEIMCETQMETNGFHSDSNMLSSTKCSMYMMTTAICFRHVTFIMFTQCFGCCSMFILAFACITSYARPWILFLFCKLNSLSLSLPLYRSPLVYISQFTIFLRICSCFCVFVFLFCAIFFFLFKACLLTFAISVL